MTVRKVIYIKMNSPTEICYTGRNRLLLLTTAARYRWLRHLVLILFFAAAIYNGKEMFVEPLTTISKIISILLLLGLFYLNMYWLVPKLLFKNRYGQYGLSIAALFIIVLVLKYSVKPLLRPYLKAEYEKQVFESNILGLSFIFLVLVTATTAIKLFQRWVYDTQRISQLEITSVQSELKHLKNQLNPHFLFNMLNNANVLIEKDPEKASQVLMKLSDLLRYQLYDSARNKVLLTADIHFLTDFLNLEKIRRDNFTVLISKEGEISGVQVPPLLLITFVENAVKHSMDVKESTYVHVYVSVQNRELRFACVNSKPKIAVAKSHSGGVGLANVRRTLELVYPSKHNLNIQDSINTFEVNLTIQL